MAYADFNLTDFGVRWLAQAVDDAQNGTTDARVSAMLFGHSSADAAPLADMSGADLWTSDSTSLRVYASGTSVGVRGIASNAALESTFEDFNCVQLVGLIGAEGGIIAWSVSDTPEDIPPAVEQVVQRTMTINFAAGAAASITCDAVQSGYALEDGVAKLAPATNDADLRLGNVLLRHAYGLTGFTGKYAQSAIEWESAGGASFGMGVNPLKGAVGIGPAIYTPGGLTTGGNASIGGNASVTGTATIGGDLGVTGSASVGGKMGGASAILQAQNAPGMAVYDGASYTVFSANGVKNTGVLYNGIVSMLGLGSRNGVLIVIYSDGTVQVGTIVSGTPTIGISGDTARLVLAYLA